MQQGRRSVEAPGVDLRTRVKRLGAKGKARRKKCKVRFSLIKKNIAFQKRYMKVGGVKKLLRAGMVPARTWRVHAVEMALTERDQLQEADGSSSGARIVRFLCLCSWKLFGLEVDEDLSAVAAQTWVEVVWIVK